MTLYLFQNRLLLENVLFINWMNSQLVLFNMFLEIKMKRTATLGLLLQDTGLRFLKEKKELY